MQYLINSYRKTGYLNHAYLLEGEREPLLRTLYSFIEEDLGMRVKGNPDIWRASFLVFGIDESRRLKEEQMRKPVSGDKKVMIISADSMTREAESALLKVFEEPIKSVHIFLIIRSARLLLPTLRSRMVLLRFEMGSLAEELAEQFLKASIPERLKLAKPIIDAKDKQRAVSLLNNIEKDFHEKIKIKEVSNAEFSAFQQIFECRKYLDDRAPSVKMILEHISIALPYV